MQAKYYTTRALSEQGKEQIPKLYQTGAHLVYSSPATLSFNSPGAEGFGVKRAGLALPGSVMLVVSPGCCGRNTSAIAQIKGYGGRFHYLMMDETDLVTGRHLKKIPEAVKQLVDSLGVTPSVVMICITCVDALLGTDMERICKKAEEVSGVRVRPCYMYALTREGRKPPMVHVRQSLYSLLPAQKKRGTTVNLLGFFAHLHDSSEIYELLRAAGVKRINEISRMKTYEAFETMGEANFNLVLNNEARPAAEDLFHRLNMPYIELQRFYDIDRIRKQYQALGAAIGAELPADEGYDRATGKIADVQELCALQGRKVTVSIGETMNGNPFEMALALTKYGFKVKEIFGTPVPEFYVYINALAEASPDTRIYSNMDPSMVSYEPDGVDITIGKDAAWYHPEAQHVLWSEDVQPYGYDGVYRLFAQMEKVLSGPAGQEAQAETRILSDAERYDGTLEKEDYVELPELTHKVPSGKCVKGLRLVLTPFAPDQSGAQSVFYDLGGLTVILDAGGCTGNICGFDEPRWFGERSAVFSAGLRDMDAIMGRDKLLVEKTKKAIDELAPSFAAIVGTPVPAVIATDYHAIKKMIERKTDIPIITVEANGMRLYDEGEEEAYLKLFKTMAARDESVDNADDISKRQQTKRLGVIGAIPLEMSEAGAAEQLKETMLGKDWDEVICYGAGASIQDVIRAGAVAENLVLSPAGIKAAEYLKKTFGTPYTIGDPMAKHSLEKAFASVGASYEANVFADKKILIVHQQVKANALRELICEDAVCATWFMLKKDLAKPQDVRLKEESDFANLVCEGGFDVIMADPVLEELIPEYDGLFLPLSQFAVSGKFEG